MTASERPNADPGWRPSDGQGASPAGVAAAPERTGSLEAPAPEPSTGGADDALAAQRQARALRRQRRLEMAAQDVEMPAGDASGVVDLSDRRNRWRLRRQAAGIEALAQTVARRQAEGRAPQPRLVPARKRTRLSAWRSRLSRLKPRRLLVPMSFALVVALPSVVAAVYLFFIAADQYDSSVSFTIRSLSPASAAGGVLGMLTSNVSGTTTSDSYILINYLQSQQGVEDIDKQVNLRQVFNRNGADWFFRLGKDAPIEDLVRYWNRMVGANFEASTGIISIDVKAFSAPDAQRVAQAILNRSLTVITALSKQAREDAVSFAKNEVARAEMRLKFADREVQNFRNSSQEIDPSANVKVAMEVIGSLQKSLTEARAEQRQLSGYLNKNSPALQLLSSKIASLEKQLAEEQKVLGTGNSVGGTAGHPASSPSATLSAKVGRYQELLVEQGFAQKAYTTALGGLEKAEVEAAAHDRFLATFVTPTMAQTSEYPRRIVYSLVVFGGLLILWGSTVLIVYNIRDRV
jgi:capsular polysaccharide transport system permease protein